MSDGISDGYKYQAVGEIPAGKVPHVHEGAAMKQPTTDITTLTAQNVILGMGIEEVICHALSSTGQQIRDRAIAIHKASQAGNAPSAVEAEIAALKRQLAEMTTDRNLWRDDHDGDCPYVAENETLKAEVARVSGAAWDVLEDGDLDSCDGCCDSPSCAYYRLRSLIAARLTPPGHGDAPAQEEQP